MWYLSFFLKKKILKFVLGKSKYYGFYGVQNLLGQRKSNLFLVFPCANVMRHIVHDNTAPSKKVYYYYYYYYLI